MPDISSELAIIQLASYGEQVRDAVTSAMKKINNLGIGTVDDAPIQNSVHPAKSGGIYDALQQEANQIDRVTVTLQTGWSSSEPFTKSFSITGVTANTKIDIIADSTLFNAMIQQSIRALWIQNNNGSLTAYALGSKPTSVLTFDCELTEGVT